MSNAILDYQRRSKGKMAFLNEKITRFYEENSRMLPGKKNCKKKRSEETVNVSK